ncbi:hypothetical protein BGX31_002915 [Mortierella sp. GBA43]|nr:hypothetical protein BGX31_002915 [Mortierella sp. GBA43]
MFGFKRSSDFLVALSQPTDTTANTYYATVTVKDRQRLNVACTREHPERIRIDLTAVVDENPFDGFLLVSILQENNIVRSFNSVGVKTKKMTLLLHPNYVMKNELYDFKILLVAKSSTIYKPSVEHPGPWGTVVAMSLLPPKPYTRSQPVKENVEYERRRWEATAEKRKQEAEIEARRASDSKSPTPAAPVDTAPVGTTTPKTLQPTAATSPLMSPTPRPRTPTPSADKLPGQPQQQPAQGPTIADTVPTEHTPVTPLPPTEPPKRASVIPFSMTAQPKLETLVSRPSPEHTTSTPDQSSKPPSSNGTVTEDTPFDVLFYHFDTVTGSNSLIGAHRSVLKAYPSLSRLVEKAEASRNEIVSEMKLTTKQSSPALSIPIVVEVSYLPLSAFKALISFVYNQDVTKVLSNVTELIHSSPLSAKGVGNDNNTEQDAKLSLDDLLFLAHRFQVRELFDVCVEVITSLLLNVDNAIHILVHFGGAFDEIKRPVMKFIGDHFQDIFGRNDDDMYDPFEAFQDRGECRFLMAEILRMIARKDMTIRPPTPPSPFVMV